MSLAEGSDIDDFAQAEAKLNLKIPSNLKNVLEANGYHSLCLVSTITSDDLSDIETFCRETLLHIIPVSEREKYYGTFHRCPEKYVMLGGHKKIIKLLGEFYKTQVNKENVNPSKSLSTKPAAKSVGLPLALPVSKELAKDLTKENGFIIKNIKNWIKNKCNEEQWAYYEPKCNDIIVKCKVDSENELYCLVECFCKTVIKIQKAAAREDLRKHWIYSNFYKHCFKHLKAPSSDSTGKQAIEKRKKSTILNYFETSRIEDQILVKKIRNDALKELPSTSAQPSALPSTSLKEPTLVKNGGKNIHILQDVMLNNVKENNNLPLPEKSTNNIQINIDDTMREVQELDTIEEKQENDEILPQSPTSNTMNVVSKWSSIKYQRSERSRRKRERQDISSGIQPIITNYFPIVEKIATIIDDNSTLSQQFIEYAENYEYDISSDISYLEENSEKNVDLNNTSRFLSILMEMSQKNKSQLSNNNIYPDTLKKFALYLYYIGGRLLYETLYSNLRNTLPSITALNRYVEQQNKKTEEGLLDFTELNDFLEERNMPKVVWISEDGTRISGKVEYDSKSNKILGFVLPLNDDGLPKRDTFIASSAERIYEYFSTGEKSNYGYIIMAQPLSDRVSPFCLSIYGTNNKFTYNDVLHRWDTMKKKAAEFGIRILGFSSDGDSRLLKAMKITSKLPGQMPLPNWEWCHLGNMTSPETYIQDTTHILTKLRTRLLKPGIILPMGNYFTSVSHLDILIKTVSRDKHFLVPSDLKPEDKMNFRAAEKMCSTEVINLLKTVPDSIATVAFLKIMHLTIKAFLEKTVNIHQRLYSIWYVVFFLRIWKKWIADHENYKVHNNFISLNCYTCLELNAHGILKLINHFQSEQYLTEDMFLPWLFGSQACEKMFRSLRSMTSTFSTVVNFSMKDILHRINRIKAINFILSDLNADFVFPREHKKDARTDRILKSGGNNELKDVDIHKTIDEARKDAVADTKNLGMFVQEDYCNLVLLRVDLIINEESRVGLNAEASVQEETTPENIEVNGENEIDEDILSTEISGQIGNDIYTRDDKEDQNSEDERTLNFDLRNLARFGENLNLKKFPSESSNISQDSPFVEVCVSNKTVVIKKSSLCWLLDQGNARVSTDRLKRFIVATKRTNNTKRLRKSKKSDTPPQQDKMLSRKVKQSSKRKQDQYLSSSEDSISSANLEFHDTTDTTEQFSSDNSEDKDNKEYVESIDIVTESYYAVYYDENWFIGRIIEIIDDRFVKIKFLREVLSQFIWPKSADVDTVDKKFVIYGPVTLLGTGPFELKRYDYIKIVNRYKKLKSIHK